MPINKDNYLIQACITNKKFETFDFLMKNNFLTEEKLYDCMFVYKHKEMFEEGKHLFQSDLSSILKAWDRNASNNLRQRAVSRNICLAFAKHTDLVSGFNQSEKEQYKQFALLFLLYHCENLESAKDKEEVKRLFMFFYEAFSY